MSNLTKQLLIHSIEMLELDGSANVPTALAYSASGAPLIGHAARNAAPKTAVNEDFKVELGMVHPTGAKTRRQFLTADGGRKSAAELAADFCRISMARLKEWLADRGLAQATTILVAEPLQLQSDDAPPDWLPNYRSALRRILLGQGFADVEFLPEPFAVFQYYRYGIRVHPVIERTKHVALVIDAGGGTTDVCVIETTKDGDISQSGPNSRPLGAASVPHGGYALNRAIAQFLLRKAHFKLSAKINTGVGQYKQWKRGQIALDTMAQEYRTFIANYHQLVHDIEEPKVALCRSVARWTLDADVTDAAAVPISIPANPFASEGGALQARLTVGELRKIYLDEIWRPHFRPLIQSCLSRSKSELRGQAISVCLLSGGASNVGWLRLLVEAELESGSDERVDAIPIPDYQEVVAKGLAVECARRFFNKGGDFSEVMTYNRLCLVLNPDDHGAVLKRFVPQNSELPATDGVPGVLLPSATVLRRFIDEPMEWKVRLDKAPKQRLEYFFLRSSFDPGDVASLQNVEERSVATPKNTNFDSQVKVQLTVRQDGTATPEFVYHQGRDGTSSTSVQGKPFYLDMTYGSVASASAYVGFDFGTSNSSMSYIDERRVQTYQSRAAQRGWQTLGELVNQLPAPLAALLAKYQSEVEPQRSMKAAFEFIEAALTLYAYVAFADYSAHRGRAQSRLWKNFSKRSAGPLWALLKGVLGQPIDDDAWFGKVFKAVVVPESAKVIDEAIDNLNSFKHDRLPAPVDLRVTIELMADIGHKAFKDVRFGFFENVQQARFQREFTGLFRLASGVAPYYDSLKYRGLQAFSDSEPFLLQERSGHVLSLSPFGFWDTCQAHPDLPSGHLFVYDSSAGSDASFKALGAACVREISSDSPYRMIGELLEPFRAEDQRLDVVQAGSFEPHQAR